jgi:hypothetical protein
MRKVGFRWVLNRSRQVFALLLVASVIGDTILIVRAILAQRSPTELQSVLGSISTILTILAFASRQTLLSNVGDDKLRQIANELVRKRRYSLQEERKAALLHIRHPPIDLRLSMVRNASEVGLVKSVTFCSIKRMFETSRFGRFYIIGSPGAGKTLLAIQLACELIGESAEDATLIPVILPLQEWRADNSSLDRWFAYQAADKLDVPIEIARLLIDNGMILPVLDGLDEMATSSARRGDAADFIDALNNWDGCVIVTCRTDTWAAIEAGGTTMEDATGIILTPVTPRQQVAYLNERNRTGRNIIHLEEDILKRPKGLLAATLSNPLDLMLAGSLLSGGSGTETLIRHINMVAEAASQAGLESDLMEAFVRTRAEWYPKDTGSKTRSRWKQSSFYSESQVLSWSRALARLVNEVGDKYIFGYRMPSTSITIERLWLLSGPSRARTIDRILVVVFWLPFLLALSTTLAGNGVRPEVAVGVSIVLSVLPASSIWLTRTWVHPSKIVFSRLIQKRGIIRLLLSICVASALLVTPWMDAHIIGGLLFAFGFLLVFGLGFSTNVRESIAVWAVLAVSYLIGMTFQGLIRLLLANENPSVEICAGVASGAVSMLVAVRIGILVAKRHGGGGLDIFPPGAPTPRAGIDGDLRAGICAACVTFAVGALIGFTSRTMLASPQDFLGVSLLAGLAAGPGYVSSVWRRHLALVISARGRLPLRVCAFLQWSHRSGLLRTAGRAYEFRHRRLLDWLAR